MHRIITQDVVDAARSFSIDSECIPHLVGVFNDLGALRCFPHIAGAEEIVILDSQWLLDSMVLDYPTQSPNKPTEILVLINTVAP